EEGGVRRRPDTNAVWAMRTLPERKSFRASSILECRQAPVALHSSAPPRAGISATMSAMAPGPACASTSMIQTCYQKSEVRSQKSGINKTTRQGRPGGTQWSRVGHPAMTILAFRFLLLTSASRSRGQVGIKILQCLADVFVLLEHV